MEPFSFSGANISQNNSAFYDVDKERSAAVNYVWKSEPSYMRVLKRLFSCIICPVGLYRYLHGLVGKKIVVSSSDPECDRVYHVAKEAFISHLSQEEGWLYKRIDLEVDGYHVEAALVGKPTTLQNGRWVLFAQGNNQFYEDCVHSSCYHGLLDEIHGNGIVFNYPGVGVNRGLPDRELTVKAYRAALSFLEDQQHGIGAKEIIGYGYSFGGAVQGEALRTHTLKKDIKYVFVTNKTFSNLSSAAAVCCSKLLGWFAKISGWNISALSKKIRAPAIILQRANVAQYEQIHDGSLIIDDGSIPAQASLARAILQKPQDKQKNTMVIGVPDGHFDEITNMPFVAQCIEEHFAPSSIPRENGA